MQTIPGQHWFSYFRFYGPLEAYFDRSWKLGDITLRCAPSGERRSDLLPLRPHREKDVEQRNGHGEHGRKRGDVDQKLHGSLRSLGCSTLGEAPTPTTPNARDADAKFRLDEFRRAPQSQL